MVCIPPSVEAIDLEACRINICKIVCLFVQMSKAADYYKCYVFFMKHSCKVCCVLPEQAKIGAHSVGTH